MLFESNEIDESYKIVSFVLNDFGYIIVLSQENILVFYQLDLEYNIVRKSSQEI